jgi:hypothetical protein
MRQSSLVSIFIEEHPTDFQWLASVPVGMAPLFGAYDLIQPSRIKDVVCFTVTDANEADTCTAVFQFTRVCWHRPFKCRFYPHNNVVIRIDICTYQI